MTVRKRNNRFRSRSDRGRRRTPQTRRGPEPEIAFKPRVNPQLDPFFRQIGVPEDQPFVPDPFQIEALKKLKAGDVIVSVPTGAGKTYIAVEAMKDLLARGGRAWYASPLKALSNSKFLEFGQVFGQDRVGLLTGDHKVNSDAPLIVGTTEILRNQLYDAMSTGQDLGSDLVVMDEAHYLGDPDRGVVWEEVVIYLPARVKLLLLSATIANAVEISDWLTFVRGQPCATVLHNDRPVPLKSLFLFPDGELVPLTKGPGLFPKINHFIRKNPYKRRWGGPYQTPFGRIFKVLDMADLLPAIFFLKSRADCDQAIARLHGIGLGLDPAKKKRLEARIDELIEKYPFLGTHPHLKYLREQGLAAHHAGHLPHWKLVIEQLMQEGLLRAIFSTSTVAAGVNFPARTVVITQSDRFNGREFADLSATDLLQMTGRAGRRGMDQIGFALIVPGPFQDIPLISALFHSSPEPIRSRMVINFSMTLNLLMSHRPEEIKPMLDLSLAAFQQGKAVAGPKPVQQDIERLTGKLNKALRQGRCGNAEQAVFLYRRSLKLEREARRLKAARPKIERESLIAEVLVPGRLFERTSGQVFCVIKSLPRQDRPGVLAVKVTKDRVLKNGRLRIKWIALDRVNRVFETVLDIASETPSKQQAAAIRSAAGLDHVPLDMNRLVGLDQSPLLRLETRLEEIESELSRMPCRACPLEGECLADKKGENYRLLSRLAELDNISMELDGKLWPSFVRHLEFLRAEGFVETGDELTEDGRWASRLRLDHPVIIAEAIRARAWPEEDPVLLAALVAPFVVDSDKAADSALPHKRIPRAMTPAWMKLEQAVAPLMKKLTDWGFDTPVLNLRAALAIHSWADSDHWDEAVGLYGLGEGDMAMLVFRTADNLRQMAGLADTHPDLAATARKGVDLILKEPVIVPL